jgi:predicted AAA+ superfamily ATPase
VSEKTVRHYLDILESTFMVRRLDPWHENLKKRQVKTPKVYLTDSGILHSLLAIETGEDLHGHPKVGASWEGFAIHAILRRIGARREECFFWALHTGAELDLLVVRGTRRIGFEIKYSDAPRSTPSMRTALEVLKLDRLDVVHAGEHTFPMGEKLRAVALARILEDVPLLG